jgi:hypothetical protein
MSSLLAARLSPCKPFVFQSPSYSTRPALLLTWRPPWKGCPTSRAGRDVNHLVPWRFYYMTPNVVFDSFTDCHFYRVPVPEQSSCQTSADRCRRSMWRIFCAQGHDKRDTFITSNNKIGNVCSFGIHCFLVYHLYFTGHEIHLAKLNRIQISHYIVCSHKLFPFVLRLVFAESECCPHIRYRLYWELIFLCHNFYRSFLFVCKSMMLHLSFQ